MFQPHNTPLDNGLLLSPFILHNAAEIMDLKPSPTKFLFGSFSGFLLQTQTHPDPDSGSPSSSNFPNFTFSFILDVPRYSCTGPFPSLCVLSSLHTPSASILLPSLPVPPALPEQDTFPQGFLGLPWPGYPSTQHPTLPGRVFVFTMKVRVGVPGNPSCLLVISSIVVSIYSVTSVIFKGILCTLSPTIIVIFRS